MLYLIKILFKVKWTKSIMYSNNNILKTTTIKKNKLIINITNY